MPETTLANTYMNVGHPDLSNGFELCDSEALRGAYPVTIYNIGAFITTVRFSSRLQKT